MIYTFYSYKGGVGRSMALANVAELFYQSGLRVLMVDWDLEAPGLERFFWNKDVEIILNQEGVMDLIIGYKKQIAQGIKITDEHIAKGSLPFERPLQKILEVHPESKEIGKLFLLTAGNRSKKNLSSYTNTVLSFDWKDFYVNWGGEIYLEWLRKELENIADVVLIDSRTGLSEMGGVCTYHFADVVVMMCAATRQCMEGTYDMLLDLKRPDVHESRGRDLEILVIPSRVEESESDDLALFQEEFNQLFEIHTPSQIMGSNNALWQLGIPYRPRYAYNERIAVTEQDNPVARKLVDSYSQLTFALSRLAPIESRIRQVISETKVSIGNRDVIGANIGSSTIIQGNNNTIVINESQTKTTERATALDNYLEYVISRNRYLQLQGIWTSGKLVNIELEKIFIPLRTNQLDQIEANSVEQILNDHKHLVVLGNPGSGKTTFVRHLALLYARDMIQGTKFLQDKLNLAESGVLPILIQLRQLGRFLLSRDFIGDTDGYAFVLNFLFNALKNERVEIPSDFFDRYLEQGKAIILLDGLDDISDTSLRSRITRLIDSFALAYPQCRMIVTSRTVSYITSNRLSGDFVTCIIKDFSLDNIYQFLLNWYLVIASGQIGEGDDAVAYATKQTTNLMNEIQTNERIRELAINPLLLTVIALVHRDRLMLPSQRAELYTEAVDILISKWDEARGIDEIHILDDRPFDAGDRRIMLQNIALYMQENRIKEIAADDLRTLLSNAFMTMTTDPRGGRKAVDNFLRVMEERTGLLSARGDGIYAFSHLTFQEYLAASAIAIRDDFLEYSLQRSSDAWWREVILLEADYLSTTRNERATRLISAIANKQSKSYSYENYKLALECLRDVSQNQALDDLLGGITSQLLNYIKRPLLWYGDIIPSINKTLIMHRINAAQAYSYRLIFQSDDSENAVEWCLIPSGSFIMGHGDNHKKDLFAHEVFLEDYYISKFPVTNYQYYLFVQKTSYPSPKQWENESPSRDLLEHPVTGVSWFDALNYCEWLSKSIRKKITLPSEAQWEKAARGNDQRIYPWGNSFRKNYCNTKELGLGHTTPVGVFPEGSSPFGCLDMFGNVWELCYRSNPREESLSYQGQINEISAKSRGGSYNTVGIDFPCYETGELGDIVLEDLGFRLVWLSKDNI